MRDFSHRLLPILLLCSSSAACAATTPPPSTPTAQAPVPQDDAPAPQATAPEAEATPPESCDPGDGVLALPPLQQESSVALIKRLNSGLSAYERTDAVWLEGGLPVAVNEDFDFATAMSLEGVGAGLAAAKRQRSNADKAASLKITADGSTRAAFDRLRACGVHAYVVLFGAADAASLKLVADRFDSTGKLIEHAVVKGETRPIAGAASWAEQGTLVGAIEASLPALPEALKPYPAPTPSSEPDSPPAPHR